MPGCRADRTLFAAKTAGKNQSPGYAQSLAAQDEFEAAIARSLADGDFELHYQPVVALGTGQVSGFEEKREVKQALTAVSQTSSGCTGTAGALGKGRR